MFLPFIIFALLSPSHYSRNSDPRSQSRRCSPLHTVVRSLHFYRDKTSALSSLVESRRITPNYAIMGALSSWLLLQ